MPPRCVRHPRGRSPPCRRSVLPSRSIPATSTNGSLSCSAISFSGLPLERSVSALSCSSCELLADALAGEALLDLALDLIERTLLAGLDVGDAHQRDRELTLAPGATTRSSSARRRPRRSWDRSSRRGSRRPRSISAAGKPSLLGSLIEILGLGELGVGLVGGSLVGEGELRDLALLGDVEGFLRRLVGSLDLVVALRYARQGLPRDSSSTLALRCSSAMYWRLFC